ncbi:MAG: hypothetical protein QM749_00940 [Aquabacterium sp.]
MKSRLITLLKMSLSTLLLACGMARAQGVPIDDETLADVWGQALFTLDNTSVNGYDFSRITINADIQLNANLGGIKLGQYTYNGNTGADIDISRLSFGSLDGSATSRGTVSITNPYIEFVYKGSDEATREVVGMRLGFGGISGDVGLVMNSVSGSLLINAGSRGSIDSGNDTTGQGKRWDGATCGTASCAVNFAQISGVTAGNASGASRDFFLSILKSNVTFPAVNGVVTPEAMAGFWLNWRDRLTAR